MDPATTTTTDRHKDNLARGNVLLMRSALQSAGWYKDEHDHYRACMMLEDPIFTAEARPKTQAELDAWVEEEVAVDLSQREWSVAKLAVDGLRRNKGLPCAPSVPKLLRFLDLLPKEV